MARLIAQSDIWVPREPYGRRLIARKGQLVPARYSHLLTADAKKLTASAAEGGDPAAATSTPDGGAYDGSEWTVPKLKALVAERGLTAESDRKADLIDALEAADEAGAGD